MRAFAGEDEFRRTLHLADQQRMLAPAADPAHADEVVDLGLGRERRAEVDPAGRLADVLLEHLGPSRPGGVLAGAVAAVDLPVTVRRITPAVVHRVIGQRHTELSKLGGALELPRLFAHARQRRQQQRDQDGDDADHDQQLNQRKAGLASQ